MAKNQKREAFPDERHAALLEKKRSSSSGKRTKSDNHLIRRLEVQIASP
jgi:hypothetical protein